MANQWVRLWHDMPTDPKFRTIAKASQRPLSAVIAVYVFMLIDASTASERGRTQANAEDIASAIDLEIDDVEAIQKAMQGRVLDGNKLTGWEKRQPIREDNSAERSKAWRDGKKSERNRTQPNATERQDKDKDKDKKIITADDESGKTDNSKSHEGEYSPEFEDAWKLYPKRDGGNPKGRAFKAWNARLQNGCTVTDMIDGTKRYAAHIRVKGKEGTEFVLQAATFFGPDEHFREPWTATPSESKRTPGYDPDTGYRGIIL